MAFLLAVSSLPVKVVLIEDISPLKFCKNIRFLRISDYFNIYDYSPLYEVLDSGDTLQASGFINSNLPVVIDSLRKKGVVIKE